MVVLREGEVEKTKRKEHDARETKKFWKIFWVLTLLVADPRVARDNYFMVVLLLLFLQFKLI